MAAHHVRFEVTLKTGGVVDRFYKYVNNVEKVDGDADLLKSELSHIIENEDDTSRPFHYVIFVGGPLPNCYKKLRHVKRLQVHAVMNSKQLAATNLRDDFFLSNVRGTTYDRYQQIDERFMLIRTLPCNLPQYSTRMTMERESLSGYLYTNVKDVAFAQLKTVFGIKHDREFFNQWLITSRKTNLLALYEYYFSGTRFLDCDVVVAKNPIKELGEGKHGNWSVLLLPKNLFVVYGGEQEAVIFSQLLMDLLEKVPPIIKETFTKNSIDGAPAGGNLTEQLGSLIYMTHGPYMINPRHINIELLKKLQIPSEGKIPLVIYSKITKKPKNVLMDFDMVICVNVTLQQILNGLVAYTVRYIDML